MSRIANVDWSTIEGFEWDAGNREKNRHKHNVTTKECEEIFYNLPLYTVKDIYHSANEYRYKVLGQTNTRRLLAVAYTIRGERIRIISARDQSRSERKFYEKTKKNTEL
ncbi:MAG: hypothetical protein ACD_48C00003G0004 [uncultured bacterium]|nr:MAG: hypothetical protein ACD_48C00003G0004 [uncultured bacterium]